MSIFGGAKHISLSSDITLSLGGPRVLSLTVGAGIIVTLPPATTILGGPYFYIFSVGGHGDHDFTLKDSAGTFSDTVAANTLVTLIVGDDGTWQRAQRTGGTLQADVRPTAFGYVASGAGNPGTPSPSSVLRSYNYLVNTWDTKANILLGDGEGVGDAYASLGSDIYSLYPRSSGWPVTNARFNQAQKYTSLTNTWAEVAVKSGEPYKAHQAASANSKVYFFGEDAVGLAAGEIEPCEYDPATDTWDITWNSPEHMHMNGAGVAYNNLIYLYSGVAKNSAGAFSDITKKINSFTPATDTWSTGLTESSNAGMVRIGSAEQGGILYFAGGCPLTGTNTLDCSNPVDTHHSYNISTGNWTTETALPSPRWGKGTFSGLGDSKIYWIGGADEIVGGSGVLGTTPATADVQFYTPSGGSGTWTTTPTDYPDLLGHSASAGITGLSNSTVSATPAL